MQRMTDKKKRPGRPEKKTATTRFETRLDVPQKEAWEAQAEKEGLSLSAWVKKNNDKIAKYKTGN